MNKYVLAAMMLVTVALVDLLLIRHNLTQSEHHKKLLREKIIEQAKVLFDVMVIVRSWNANHEALYAKNDSLAPNPYLKDNTLSTEGNETLVRINPAWMTRQISEIATARSDYIYKITSLDPLNPVNAPDVFEREALRSLEDHRNEMYYYDADNGFAGQEHFDMVGALPVLPECLECHYEQGYRTGDLRGGIRISVPLHQYRQAVDSVDRQGRFTTGGILVSSILIALFMLLIIELISRRQRQIQRLNHDLHEQVTERTRALTKSNRALNHLNAHLEERIDEAVEKHKTSERMLITQSRYAAMGEMIGMIAHQWRQPLSEIAMASNNIYADLTLNILDTDSIKADIESITKQTEHLSKTIDDFANFFKPDRDKEEVLINEVCLNAIEILKKMADKCHLKLHTDFNSDLRVSTYKRELMHVIVNLIKNARDAYAAQNIHERPIWISTEACDNGVRVGIRDQAGGIDPDLLEKIFEPYFTTKADHIGNGLGLYIAKIIVEEHLDGIIYANNRDGGAHFVIEIRSEAVSEK